jgi:hypothetical protein
MSSRFQAPAGRGDSSPPSSRSSISCPRTGSSSYGAPIAANGGRSKLGIVVVDRAVLEPASSRVSDDAALAGSDHPPPREVRERDAEQAHPLEDQPGRILRSEMPANRRFLRWARLGSNQRPLACEAWRSWAFRATKYLQIRPKPSAGECRALGLVRPNTAGFSPTNGPTARSARDIGRRRVASRPPCPMGDKRSARPRPAAPCFGEGIRHVSVGSWRPMIAGSPPPSTRRSASTARSGSSI